MSMVVPALDLNEVRFVNNNIVIRKTLETPDRKAVYVSFYLKSQRVGFVGQPVSVDSSSVGCHSDC